MIKILNENYYFDLDVLDGCVQMPKVDSYSGENHINIVKYEMIKLMVEVVMDSQEEVDEKLGPRAEGMSIPFKLAFNTLLNKKIINKY
jgi:hypothetical protein